VRETTERVEGFGGVERAVTEAVLERVGGAPDIVTVFVRVKAGGG
jgi:hypothetical protein